MGKTVAFSFYARAGADYSSASNALSVVVQTATGTDQSIINTWTGGASAIGGTQTATLTTTWQRFTYTGTASASGTQIGFYFNYTPVGTAGAADYFEVTGVQLEIAGSASAYSPNTSTYQAELAACQRYSSRWSNPDNSFPYIAIGSGASTTVAKNLLAFPVEMRTRPTVVDYSNLFVSDTVSSWVGGTVTIANANTKSASIDYTTGATLTQFRPYFLVGNTGGFLGISAEL
jgi:hypothetical protein